MKRRSIGLMILLFFITFGIYQLYWYCSFQNQLQKQTGKGFSGVGHFFMSIITFGIYTFYWSYVVGERIQLLGGKNNGIFYLLLSLFGLGIIAYPWMQHNVNELSNN